MTSAAGTSTTVTAHRTADAAQSVREARKAAADWSRWPLEARLDIIRRLRPRLAENPVDLARTAHLPWRSNAAETLTAEVLPLLDACRFLEKRAPKVLAPKRLGRRGRPAWLFGSRLEVRREPLGVVLIIGPSNYPILLAGVQMLQALTAGNAVLVKPGRDGLDAVRHLARHLTDCGLPAGVLHVLSEEVESATAAVDEGVDKVVLTGSHATGQQVLSQLAQTATPSVMELSGCDAVYVRRDADLSLAAEAIAFGMTLNGGFTCIAPRRLLVDRSVAETFRDKLRSALARRAEAGLPQLPLEVLEARERELESIEQQGGRRLHRNPPLLTDTAVGAVLRLADIPAPAAAIFEVEGDDEALKHIARSRFRLGVSVFGSKVKSLEWARGVDAGVVVVNDVIVPTADPRAPFGGRGASGFGVTRGAEGLLEMTAVKTLIRRSGSFRPHYDSVTEADTPLFEAFTRLSHAAGLKRKIAAFGQLMRTGRERSQRKSK